MAGAFIGSSIYGNFEGAAAMGGATIGGIAGVVVGFIGGLVLVLWDKGRRGPALPSPGWAQPPFS